MIGLAVLAVTLAPVAEEVFFRGFLYNALQQRRLPTMFAACIQSALFAAVHHYGAYPTVVVFFMGMVLSGVYSWRQTLLTPILTHGVINFFVMLGLVVLAVENANAPVLGVRCSSHSGGLLVDEVVAGTAAEREGIRPGDILAAYDGTALSKFSAVDRPYPFRFRRPARPPHDLPPRQEAAKERHLGASTAIVARRLITPDNTYHLGWHVHDFANVRGEWREHALRCRLRAPPSPLSLLPPSAEDQSNHRTPRQGPASGFPDTWSIAICCTLRASSQSTVAAPADGQNGPRRRSGTTGVNTGLTNRVLHAGARGSTFLRSGLIRKPLAEAGELGVDLGLQVRDRGVKLVVGGLVERLRWCAAGTTRPRRTPRRARHASIERAKDRGRAANRCSG